MFFLCSFGRLIIFFAAPLFYSESFFQNEFFWCITLIELAILVRSLEKLNSSTEL